MLLAVFLLFGISFSTMAQEESPANDAAALAKKHWTTALARFCKACLILSDYEKEILNQINSHYRFFPRII